MLKADTNKGLRKREARRLSQRNKDNGRDQCGSERKRN